MLKLNVLKVFYQVKHVLGILSVNSFVVHDGAEDGMDLIGKLYI